MSVLLSLVVVGPSVLSNLKKKNNSPTLHFFGSLHFYIFQFISVLILAIYLFPSNLKFVHTFLIT